jgi:hypothetical protein
MFLDLNSHGQAITNNKQLLSVFIGRCRHYNRGGVNSVDDLLLCQRTMGNRLVFIRHFIEFSFKNHLQVGACAKSG